MNPFYEPFHKTVEVGSKRYSIKTDFRAVLKLLDCLEEKEDPADKVRAVLGMYENELPADVEAAIRAVTDFLTGDKEGKADEKEEMERQKTLSYKKDAPYIIGDFLRFYGIDLTSCHYLHWQKFQTLLTGLSEDSETKKRIAYRRVDVGKIKDKHERARIIRIQKAISIEDTEADAERIGDLFGGLMWEGETENG